ncbi:ribosomal protein L35 [Sulfobacillus acidophilus TPY]|jgi:large subunit ribosomal protein L35|uniref:Large ribosomal subunit protein bL35 n=1 Tax=Sulfobacillus acidophilus (strain ATCC 700253 / DSM 10332 / NAL) TaxID=679936 RepID=G8TWH0_SULAD|nr:ribosomal protein L35 [Sulfobacillus acidophilus TPY]AEW04868.1 50S ribosomal protein L35 [Sulfobacillus acidophilus DSM 10332]
MPKMKTHRGAAKRITLTGRGKAKRHRAGKSHLLVHKSADRRRRLRGSQVLSDADQHRVKRLLPYQ